MKKIILSLLFLFISSVSFAGATGVSFSSITFSGDDRTIFVCVGDSITNGTGSTDAFGYRKKLQENLGLSNINFKGLYSNGTNPEGYSTLHEGVGGQITTEILARIPRILSDYLDGVGERTILIHAGTNDAWDAITESESVGAVEDMIDAINAFDSDINVYIALIIPIDSASDSIVTSYNTALNTMLETYQASKTNLYIVDMNSAFKANANWGADYLTVDHVHPIDAGYQVMANTWATAIQENE